MMSLQVAPEINLIYDRIWKMFDDCIKTNRFSKIQNLLCVGSRERCALGLIISYTGIISPHGKIISDIKAIIFLSICFLFLGQRV